MTVNDASLGESGSKLSKVAATSLLMGVTRASSEAYFFIILLVPILASKCIEFEGDSWVTLKNNADYGVVALFADLFTGFCYPDTLLPEIPVFYTIVDSVKSNPKEDQIVLYGGSSFSKALKTNTTSDTLSVFVFHIDTLLSHSWKEIRNGYKILVRYDLSAEDLESLKGKIYYPPTTAMRNIHMFPPYEKVKTH